MNYQIQKTLSQRGPVEQLEDQDVDGVLLVGDVVILRWEEHESCGTDCCSLRPCVYRGEHAWLERRSWSPARGYSASGEEERIVPFEEGVAFLLKNGAFEHLWSDAKDAPDSTDYDEDDE